MWRQEKRFRELEQSQSERLVIKLSTTFFKTRFTWEAGFLYKGQIIIQDFLANSDRYNYSNIWFSTVSISQLNYSHATR